MSQASARGWTRSWPSALPSCGTALPRMQVVRPRATAGAAAAGGSSSSPSTQDSAGLGGRMGSSRACCVPPPRGVDEQGPHAEGVEGWGEFGMGEGDEGSPRHGHAHVPSA